VIIVPAGLSPTATVAVSGCKNPIRSGRVPRRKNPIDDQTRGLRDGAAFFFALDPAPDAIALLVTPFIAD